jgi:hypothetical protein
MLQDDEVFEEFAESGLRFCAELQCEVPTRVSACAWFSPSELAVCGDDGTVVIHQIESTGMCITSLLESQSLNAQQTECSTCCAGVSPAYGVYFSTVPVPYDDGRPDITSTDRRISQAWSLLQFIPGRDGMVAFVQVFTALLSRKAVVASSSIACIRALVHQSTRTCI